MKLRNLIGASTLTLSMIAGGGVIADTTKSLNAAVGLGPKNSTMVAYNAFADYIAENSDLEIKVFSMSLLSMKETPPGIRDGLADLGFVIAAYFPAEYSETNLAANLSMLSTAGTKVEVPGAAMAGAMTEYVFNCPDCLAEYEEQRHVYLGSVATAPYVLLCTKPVSTIADLQGTKIRSGAANFTRWAEKFGAIAVSMPADENYEALDQGVIDCTMIAASDLTNYSLKEVVEYINPTIPGGVFSSFATNNFNVDVWNDLTVSQREVVLRASAKMQAEMTADYFALAQKDIVDAPENGVQVIETSPELAAATDQFIQDDLAIIEQQFTKDYGVDDAATKIAEVQRLVEKWKALTADIGTDPEALTQVYWDEIFSKIDPATYGVK